MPAVVPGCDVRLMLPSGVGEVEWMLDPGAPTPVPSSTEIQVLVTERGCAGGQEMGERSLGPQVVETDDVVRIAVGVIPQAGSQDCPGNPSTPPARASVDYEHAPDLTWLSTIHRVDERRPWIARPVSRPPRPTTMRTSCDQALGVR